MGAHHFKYNLDIYLGYSHRPSVYKAHRTLIDRTFENFIVKLWVGGDELAQFFS